MQLSQPTRLKRNKRSSNRRRNRKRSRINHPKRPTTSRHRLRSIVPRNINIRVIPRQRLILRRRNRRITNRSVQDIRIRLRQVLEHRLVHPKVLQNNIQRCMQYPVIDHKSGPDFVEVPVVEGEQVLVFVVQALDNVGYAFGKVPDVAGVELGDLVAAVGVDGGDEDAACVEETPFGLLTVSKPSLSRGRDEVSVLPPDANAVLGSHPSANAAVPPQCLC